MIRQRVTSFVAARASQYEQRTGDFLPLNMLSKIATSTGAILLVNELATNGSAEEALLPCGLIVGGLVLDVVTGGLQRYSS